jgi:hypothetical protein
MDVVGVLVAQPFDRLIDSAGLRAPTENIKSGQNYPPFGLFSLHHPLHEHPHIDDLDALEEADIDQLVCALYGLTKDEIALIEEDR